MPPQEALTDTGAGLAIVVSIALGKIEKELHARCLQAFDVPRQWLGAIPRAQGVGGEAKVVGGIRGHRVRGSQYGCSPTPPLRFVFRVCGPKSASEISA
jgi:hypothetical protein